MKTKSPFTKKQRLALYKKALSDYRKPGTDNKRDYGLCWYFMGVHNFNCDTKLPELWEASLPTRQDDNYWWPNGDKAPRIKCLKKAIEILS